VALKRERTEYLEPKEYISELEIVSRFYLLVILIGVVASTALAGFGLWLAFLRPSPPGQNSIDILGLMKVTTFNAGVALAALGIAGIILTIRRALNSFDKYLDK